MFGGNADVISSPGDAKYVKMQPNEVNSRAKKRFKTESVGLNTDLATTNTSL